MPIYELQRNEVDLSITYTGGSYVDLTMRFLGIEKRLQMEKFWVESWDLGYSYLDSITEDFKKEALEAWEKQHPQPPRKRFWPFS
jgi:hypothetical protein